MTAFDLKDMYCSLEVHESIKPYLGFAFVINGQKRFFRYRVLPFGLNMAVTVVGRLTGPIQSFYHKLAINIFQYIDDSLVKDSSALKTFLGILFAASIFKFTGWKLNMAKSSFMPAKKLKFLGFWLDTGQS